MHVTKKWHCDAVIVQQHFDVLTHILLMSVKSALNHMESLITYRGWRECYKTTQGNREDGDSSKQEDQPYICAPGFNVRSSSGCNIAPVFPIRESCGDGHDSSSTYLWVSIAQDLVEDVAKLPAEDGVAGQRQAVDCRPEGVGSPLMVRSQDARWRGGGGGSQGSWNTHGGTGGQRGLWRRSDWMDCAASLTILHFRAWWVL